MKKIIYIILAIFLISCKQKPKELKQELKKVLISEKLTYEVINYIIESTPKEEGFISNYLVYDNFPMSDEEIKSNDFMGISKMDTLFSKIDVKYILEQNKNRMNFSLKQSLIKNKTIIPNKKLVEFYIEKNGVKNFWENYRKIYGDQGFYSISQPLFSIDKKTVIISKGFHCGSLCGWGSTIILKKNNGKWKIISVLESWQS